MSSVVAIVDYGSGNLHSAAKAFDRAAREGRFASEIVVTTAPDQVAGADRIVLPGVGAFADCWHGLAALNGMREAIEWAVKSRGRPFLGICVGMQLMATRGLEHGETPGLDWIGGEIVAIKPDTPECKVPHMGWNDIIVVEPSHPVLAGFGARQRDHFYFVHSYRFAPRSARDILAVVNHGGPVAAAVGRDNVVGVQFHPEKSQTAGLRLIANFLDWSP